MDERIFFCTENGAHKFWRVRVEEKTQIVRWGRIGTEGQALSKEFVTPEDALTATERLIAQKLAKGYRAVTAVEADVPVAAPAVPRRRRIAVPSRQLLLPLDDSFAVPRAEPTLADAPLSLVFDW